MSAKTLILAAGVGAGHNQAASAIEQEVARRPEAGHVERIDILETTNEAFQKLYDDAYFTLVEEVPWLIGWGYDSQDPAFKTAPLIKWWDQLNTLALVRSIRDFDPDVVICTHFLPARLVALMLARRQLRASLNVVMTDYDFQGLWLTSPFTRFFVARDEAREYMTSIGVPGDRVSASGIPVRSGVATPGDPDAIRARFGLPADRPVVLISAGAAGGAYAANAVRQVRRLEQRFHAVVLCGRNDQLRREVEEVAALDPDRFTVLGFTDEMADLLSVASLFVGKPGGLSSSECMAAGVPMVLINAIPGQEVRNADYLVEAGAAVRCNYATTIGYKIGTLLDDPGRLRTMAAHARRVGRPDAGRTVAAGSVGDDLPPLWISREARKSMLLASQEGIAAADLPGERRLQTLSDPATGASRAVMTASQLRPLGVSTWSRDVRIVRRTLRALRWQPDNLDLAITGKWLLGDRRAAVFDVT